MIVYRLSKKQYKDDLSGKGAEIAGGRWNSKGNAVLYTGENRALCMVEVAVHLPFGILPKDYYLIRIDLPSDIEMDIIEENNLPENWRSFPYIQATKLIGDKFLEENKVLVLKVPSAVVQGASNYLINPKHKEFKKVKVIETEEFNFDERLFRR